MNPEFLSLAEVLEIHRDQIDRYGGSPGIRDKGEFSIVPVVFLLFVSLVPGFRRDDVVKGLLPASGRRSYMSGAFFFEQGII